MVMPQSSGGLRDCDEDFLADEQDRVAMNKRIQMAVQAAALTVIDDTVMECSARYGLYLMMDQGTLPEVAVRAIQSRVRESTFRKLRSTGALGDFGSWNVTIGKLVRENFRIVMSMLTTTAGTMASPALATAAS